MQIRSIYFCIETCIGENINWKSYNRIIKLSTSYIIVKYIRVGLVLERFLPRGVEGADILGAFHLVKISAISVSEVNGTRFVGSSHWKIPRKSGKSKKVGPFSRLEFPNGMSCSIYVSRSLYQFQVHRRAPRRTGVYDQMEQLFINRKFHFCSHQNFRVFFPKRKAPLVSSLKCQKAREISQVIERLATNSPFFLLFWLFFDSWQDEVLNIAKIGLLNRTFNSHAKGQVLCLLRKIWHHVDVRRPWSPKHMES